jgi:hypothetical protein
VAEGRQVPDRIRDDEGAEVPAWVPKFWAGLMVTGSLREALAEAGIDFETAWAFREDYPVFAMYWDRAMRVHKRIDAGMPFGEAAAREQDPAL